MLLISKSTHNKNLNLMGALVKKIFSVENNPEGLGIVGKYEFLFRTISFTTFVLMIAVNGFFGTKTGTVSDTFNLYVTPPGVMFTIWAVIYLTLFAIGIYTLVHNIWTVEIYLLSMVSNILNTLWTPLFGLNSITTNNICLFILLALFVVNEVQWVKLGQLVPPTKELEKSVHSEQLENKLNDEQTKNQIKGNVLVRNGLSFYQGWLVGASNLNIGIVLVYSLGVDKQTQMIVFWVLAPLFVIVMTILNVKVYGRWIDTLAMFISAAYALTGAMITTIKSRDM